MNLYMIKTCASIKKKIPPKTDGCIQMTKYFERY